MFEKHKFDKPRMNLFCRTHENWCHLIKKYFQSTVVSSTQDHGMGVEPTNLLLGDTDNTERCQLSYHAIRTTNSQWQNELCTSLHLFTLYQNSVNRYFLYQEDRQQNKKKHYLNELSSPVVIGQVCITRHQ